MTKFVGFTNDQMFKLAQMKGYTGKNNINDINKFIMGNDKAKSYVMDMFNQATTLVGRQKRGFAPGGMPLSEMNKYISGTTGDYKDLDTFDSYYVSPNAGFTIEDWKEQARKEGFGANTQKSADQNKLAGSTVPGATTYTPDPPDLSPLNTTTSEDVANASGTTDPNADPNTTTPTTTTSPRNFAKLTTKTPVSTISVSPGDPTLIDSTKGQVTGDITKPGLGTMDAVKTATDTTAGVSANQIGDSDIAKTADDIDTKLSGVAGAVGTIDEDNKVTAQTMTKDDLGQLDPEYDAAQIESAQTVKSPTKRTLQDGETVQSAYDKDKADEVIKETEKSFATADPSTKALVQGQLDDLMADFEGGATPVWAAGAMRTALAALNARGLNASSLAGQAIVQAAMESAIPIASADAKTVAEFEMQNLNNRQQSTILAAKQRADFLKVDFDQEFQARVKNASTISEIARQNYDADVQIALENARMAQSVDIANLNAENAKILSDAAALTKMDIANLTNKQQAQVANAKAFLDMDIANLNNKQQANMLKAQAKVDALFKDQAAENAAAQINVQEKNKVDIAIENIQATQARFNAEQQNAMATVEFQEETALNKFFASLKENRAQFNATNALAVSTANAAWYQSVTTANNAAQNQANMNDANNSTAMTKMQLEQDYQSARDLMNWVFTADQNDQQRAASILIAQMDADAKASEGTGSLFQTVIGAIAQGIGT
ncbi:MAG: hypothetical protein CMB76_02960 [Euryarchaeota archaeon]|nr:hypothetical protein [Euryarchaeota archaeon]